MGARKSDSFLIAAKVLLGVQGTLIDEAVRGKTNAGADADVDADANADESTMTLVAPQSIKTMISRIVIE